MINRVVHSVYFYNLTCPMAAKQKLRIKIKAFDHTILNKVAEQILQTAIDSGAMVAGPIPLPTKIQKFTVLRSTFVNKKARDQFEIRTHVRLIDITESTPSTIEQLTNLQVPAGVDIEIKMISSEKAVKKAKK